MGRGEERERTGEGKESGKREERDRKGETKAEEEKGTEEVEMGKDRSRGREKGWGDREGAEMANWQREETSRERKTGKAGRRCEGRRGRGRAREKGAGGRLSRGAHCSEDTRRLRAPRCPSAIPTPGSRTGPYLAVWEGPARRGAPRTPPLPAPGAQPEPIGAGAAAPLQV